MTHTDKISLKRPRLPSEWYHPSLIGSFAYIFYTLALYVVPAILARVVLVEPLSQPVTILLMLPLILLAAQGMLLFAWVGHEGFHLSLHRNKFVSALTGTFFASALPTYFETGAAISHLNHHRYTNQALDPDCQIFEQFQGFWSRLFFARTKANLKYLTNTLKMAFNQPLDYAYKFHFKEREKIILAWANMAFSLLWMAFYTTVAMYDPVTGIVSILLPITIMYFISALQPYLEHTGTEKSIGREAKSRTSLLYSLLYFGNNYHLEHHLYPGVPCYRLPAVHRWLKEKGFYDQAGTGSLIDAHILMPYFNAISDPYPHSDSQDSVADPMVPT